MEELKKYSEIIENELYSFLPDSNTPHGRVIEAAKYSLSAGGKRIRPILLLKFCEMCGGSYENALPAACAIEYMHTFSLIHDDLPCMDNDDFRRGKPSCHKAFEEATALLAGDALAMRPFGIISEAAKKGKISYSSAVKIMSALEEYAGFDGMIGGQQIDTEGSLTLNDPNNILLMYSMKTSALLKAACCCGVYCAESEREDEYIRAAESYAENMGLAFQLIDDILDITSTTEILGKPVGSDEKADKHTYAAVCGLDAARKKAADYTDLAIKALSVYPDNRFILELTNKLLDRSY